NSRKPRQFKEPAPNVSIKGSTIWSFIQPPIEFLLVGKRRSAHGGARLQIQQCGRSSAGRAPPCQGGCREFESRRPLAGHCHGNGHLDARDVAYTVGWPRGEAAACKAVYTGSNPVPTSVKTLVPPVEAG